MKIGEFVDNTIREIFQNILGIQGVDHVPLATCLLVNPAIFDLASNWVISPKEIALWLKDFLAVTRENDLLLVSGNEGQMSVAGVREIFEAVLGNPFLESLMRIKPSELMQQLVEQLSYLEKLMARDYNAKLYAAMLKNPNIIKLL